MLDCATAPIRSIEGNVQAVAPRFVKYLSDLFQLRLVFGQEGATDVPGRWIIRVAEAMIDHAQMAVRLCL